MLGVVSPLRSVSMHVFPFFLCTMLTSLIWHVVTKDLHWNNRCDFQHSSFYDLLQDFFLLSVAMQGSAITDDAALAYQMHALHPFLRHHMKS